MTITAICWDKQYVPSRNVVYREIDGEVVLVPLTGGIGDLSDDLFTLNATGKAIWQACDGELTLQQIVDDLCLRYNAQHEVIMRDVAGLVEELLARDILMPKPL